MSIEASITYAALHQEYDYLKLNVTLRLPLLLSSFLGTKHYLFQLKVHNNILLTIFSFPFIQNDLLNSQTGVLA